MFKFKIILPSFGLGQDCSKVADKPRGEAEFRRLSAESRYGVEETQSDFGGDLGLGGEIMIRSRIKIRNEIELRLDRVSPYRLRGIGVGG